MKNYINELTRINGNWEQYMGITQTINEVNIHTLYHGTVRFGFTQYTSTIQIFRQRFSLIYENSLLFA